MDSEETIKEMILQRMHRCIVCHRGFEESDIQVIAREPEMWTMLVECNDCHSRSFVAAVLNDGDPQEARFALKRLSREIVSQANLAVNNLAEASQPRERVTAEDVADMHAFLDEFDGDFRSLFRRSSG